METGESLSAPERVQRLQQALHAKAKEAPGFRFYSLCDKVWRADVLAVAWQAVRRNGGAAGVDGETVADIEAHGVDRWLGELARDLKEGTYRPKAVRQVLIPKKQRGKFRALGIPRIRDRVAQTAAMVFLSPIFEADLEPEQYAYRPGRGAHDAVKRVHRLLNTGYREVVDADLSDYFGQIPHAELLKSVARRVSDGRMLGWVKAWLEMAVEEDDGQGRQAPHEPGASRAQGHPAGFPGLSGVEQHLHASLRSGLEGAGIRPALRGRGRQLRRRSDGARQGAVSGHAVGGRVDDGTVEAANQCPEDPMLGRARGAGGVSRIPDWTQLSPGYRPCLHRHAPEPGKRTEHLPSAECPDRSTLWTAGPGDCGGTAQPAHDRLANYFNLGQVSPAYAAVDRHATRRLRRWLCHKHKVRTGKYVRFPDERLWNEYGLTRLDPRTASFPWAKA